MRELARIAETFDDQTDYDGSWDSCEITEDLAGILRANGFMTHCRAHGVYAATAPICPLCREEEGPDT